MYFLLQSGPNLSSTVVIPTTCFWRNVMTWCSGFQQALHREPLYNVVGVVQEEGTHYTRWTGTQGRVHCITTNGLHHAWLTTTAARCLQLFFHFSFFFFFFKTFYFFHVDNLKMDYLLPEIEKKNLTLQYRLQVFPPTSTASLYSIFKPTVRFFGSSRSFYNCKNKLRTPHEWFVSLQK